MRTQVQIWSYHLDRTPAEMAELQTYLALNERAKNRSIAARALLRMLLARHFGIPTAAQRFEFTPAGKPFIRLGASGHRLFVDVSHSDNVALFAFSCDDELGIDVELIGEKRSFDKVLSKSPKALKVIQLRVGERHSGALASENANPEITFHGEIAIERAERVEAIA